MSILETFAADVVAFTRANQGWAPVIVALLCFAESLAVVSFFVPATVMLVGIGGLIGASGLEFWPIWWGAVIGGILGDWVSYAVGLYFKDSAHRHWPLSRYPDFTKRATNSRKNGAHGAYSSDGSRDPCAPSCRSLRESSACRSGSFNWPM